MNYHDEFDKMLGGNPKIALEELYTSRIDKMMDRVSEGEFSDEYSAYIYDQTPIGNGTMLIEALESGDYLEDFCQSILVGRVIK
jgi:hypothetical protein